MLKESWKMWQIFLNSLTQIKSGNPIIKLNWKTVIILIPVCMFVKLNSKIHNKNQSMSNGKKRINKMKNYVQMSKLRKILLKKWTFANMNRK